MRAAAVKEVWPPLGGLLAAVGTLSQRRKVDRFFSYSVKGAEYQMLPYKENVLKGNVKIMAVHMGTLSLSQRLREQQGQSINYRPYF